MIKATRIERPPEPKPEPEGPTLIQITVIRRANRSQKHVPVRYRQPYVNPWGHLVVPRNTPTTSHPDTHMPPVHLPPFAFRST